MAIEIGLNPSEPDQVVIGDGEAGEYLIPRFGGNDTIRFSEQLFDSNGDGIVTLGRNGLLDFGGPEGSSRGTIDFDGLVAARGLRSLGFDPFSQEWVYGAAYVRPKGAIEGTVGDDVLKGSAKAESFFFDTFAGRGTGTDTITGFDVAKDRITTTQQPVAAGSENGRFTLDFSGGTIDLFGTDGSRIDGNLVLVGERVENGVSYFDYMVQPRLPDLFG